MIVTDIKAVEAAFTEWDRRYREDPEAFMSEAARVLNSDAESYGECATPYFLSILVDVAGLEED
jgi:hypothetical protein